MNKLAVGVQEYALDDLELARAELATTETPREPYDQLERLLNDTTSVDEYVWLMVPWRLVSTFLKVVEHAKNCCSRSTSYELIGVMSRVDKAIESRGPIDRLGDLVA